MPDRRRKGAVDPDLERGMPRRTVVGRNPHVAAICPTAGCGESVAETEALAKAVGRRKPPLPRGWIELHVGQSTHGARRFCSSGCAAVGIAAAQVSLIPLLDPK